MRSINIYSGMRKPADRRDLLPPLRKRRIQNRFTAVECAAAAASMVALVGAPAGGYPFLHDAIRRIDSGELKLKMNTNERTLTEGAGRDA
jgi:hypothetical protein